MAYVATQNIPTKPMQGLADDTVKALNEHHRNRFVSGVLSVDDYELVELFYAPLKEENEKQNVQPDYWG